jgi:Tol biopolymer transport system component/DNA-binding SARP family transcriptional activator
VIVLRTLGRIDLEDADGKRLDRVVVQPKRLALLTYLVVHTPHGFHSREMLLGVFWAERDTEHARRALRQALYFLRHELGSGVLVNRGDGDVGIDRAAVWCDVCAFREAVEANELERAAKVFAGPFWSGIAVSEAPEFDRWVDAERDRLGREYGVVLRTLAERAEGVDDERGAVRWWRALLEHEPYSAEIVCHTMRSEERVGDWQRALRLAENYAARVRRDFGGDPEPSVTALEMQMRGQRVKLIGEGNRSDEARSKDGRVESGGAPLQAAQGENPVPPASPHWYRISKLAVALIAVFGTMALVLGWQGRSSRYETWSVPVDEKGRFSVDSWDGAPLVPWLAISPDGRTLVYRAQGRFYSQASEGGNAVPISGSRGALSPFFSPDGRWIAFQVGDTFKRVSVNGGPTADIAHLGGAMTFGATWGEDRTIIYADPLGSSGLGRVSMSSGVSEQLTVASKEADEVGHAWPQSLEGGRLVLFTVIGPSGKWDDARIVLQDLQTQERWTVTERATYGRYVEPGYVVIARERGTIEAVPYDLGRRMPTGAPVPVDSGVRLGHWGGAAQFAVSDGGTLAFVQGSTTADHLFVWMDRSGNRLGQVGRPLSAYLYPALSADGTRVAVSLRDPENDEIYVIDTVTGMRTRITFDVAHDESPIWSPNDDRIAYTSTRAGPEWPIYVQDVRKPTQPVLLYSGRFHLHLSSWSPDGRWVLFHETHPDRGRDVYAFDLERPADPIPLLVTRANEQHARFSPNGDWIAYESQEHGPSEVFVARFPEMTEKRQITDGGGKNPIWSPNGGELFFWKHDTLIVVELSIETMVPAGPVRRLFELQGRASSGAYAVAPGGARLLLLMENEDATFNEIQLVRNWYRRPRQRP